MFQAKIGSHYKISVLALAPRIFDSIPVTAWAPFLQHNRIAAHVVLGITRVYSYTCTVHFVYLPTIMKSVRPFIAQYLVLFLDKYNNNKIVDRGSHGPFVVHFPFISRTHIHLGIGTRTAARVLHAVLAHPLDISVLVHTV